MWYHAFRHRWILNELIGCAHFTTHKLTVLLKLMMRYKSMTTVHLLVEFLIIFYIQNTGYCDWLYSCQSAFLSWCRKIYYQWGNSILVNSYSQITNIRRTLLGTKIDYHSDVVVASPVGAAPTTSSFSTEHFVSIDCAKTTTRRDERYLNSVIWFVSY